MTGLKQFILRGFILLVGFAPMVYGQSSTEFPKLTYAGVIPVQYEGAFDDLLSVKVKEATAHLFPDAVRASRRFRVINDEVVADLWSKPQGRVELVKQYELDAFLALTLAKRGDSILFVARLLSPELKSYLIETDTIPRLALAEVAPEALGARVERLVFRMVNRLPVDVVVSSVQGRYITVSGGKEQGLQNGDQLTFFRTRIKSFHPANGSWLAFDNAKLADAKIVEVNRTSAVAQIQSQTKDGAIKVGDGAKVPALASRHAFAYIPKASWEQEDEENTPINPIVTPEGMESKQQGKSLFRQTTELQKAPIPVAPVASNQSATPSAPSTTDAPAKVDEQEKTDAAKPAVAAESITPTEPEPGKESNAVFRPPSGKGKIPPAFALFQGIAEEVKVHAGARLWSASGYGSASAKMPFWIVNNLGFVGTTSVSRPEMKLDYMADIGFGPTGGGNFNSLGVGSRFYWQQPLKGLFENAQFYNLGITFEYEAMNVSSETFGGTDAMRFGLMTGLKGLYALSAKEGIDWTATATFYPQTFGIVAVRKKNREIQNASGFAFELNGFMVGLKQDLEWGAILGYEADYYKVVNKSVGVSELYLAGAGRVRF